ncbi:hypothetical protein VAR608DRAFT_5548 [Variovorax sp. HW608]|nr:hypothetical protein VAR608DRAFT_5548 [Variovorax sp. HW608]
MLTVEQLKSRYPYMFDRPHIGFEFYRGWMPILVRACAEIDVALGENKRVFHWRQIKEKWGSARFYYRLGSTSRVRMDVHEPGEGVAVLRGATRKGDALADRIDAIVDAAEEQTQTACIVCGARASLEDANGYYVTLCPMHSPEDIAGAVLS